MRKYLVFVVLFLVSLLAFFVGAFTGILPLMYAGIAGTFVLFVVSRSFIPRPPVE